MKTTTGATRALLLAAFATTASATTLSLDDEQSAAAAALSTFRLGDEVPAYLAGLTYSAKDFTERSLRLLEAQASPAAVARARHGVLVNCPVSGSFRARYSASSGIVDLEWTACAIDISGQVHILTGPGRVAVGSDFTPAHTVLLTVGNASRDLVERFVVNGVPSGPENETRRNLRLAGHITLGRETTDDNFEGSFAYWLDGKVSSTHTTQLGVPGEVFQTTESTLSADGAWVSGTLEYGDLGFEEDVRFATGRFKNRIHRGAVLDLPAETLSTALVALNLRARNAGDYQLGTETLQVDGAVHYSWPTNSNHRCADGWYAYETRVPLRHPPEFQSGMDSYDAGEVLLNGTATMTFSANADPSELGEMHIDLHVPGAGTFGYDGNSVWESGLPAAASCAE